MHSKPPSQLRFQWEENSWLRQIFNIAFLAILLDALEWSDISLCSCFLRGFPLTGDPSTGDLETHLQITLSLVSIT
jgi:hypothetical protein